MDERLQEPAAVNDGGDEYPLGFNSIDDAVAVNKPLTDVFAADLGNHPYFNVAGADPLARLGQATLKATHLIKVACETVLGVHPELKIFGTDYPTPDGTCIRDYLHVEDLARAHVRAVDYLNGGGETVVLNCGYGHGYSVKEVVDAVHRVSGVPFKVVQGPRRLGDVLKLVARNDRIRKVLGWKPELDDLDLIVAHALAWERKWQHQRKQAAA